MARYRIVALPTMSKGGIFNRKKNQAPPQVTHTAIDPAYLEKNPDVASSIQNMPEVGTSYTRKRDKWGRPEGDKWYQYDPKKKGFIDDQGRSYEPQWRTDEAIKNKEKNKSWGQRIGDFVNQDILGNPSDKELSEQMAKAKPKVFVDPSGKKHTGHGAWDNYGDAGVQMVYPEAYVMGPGAGGAGIAKQGINALMEGAAGINKFAVNDLLSAGVRSTLSPLERTLAEKATVGNVLGAYGAADAVVNKAPKFAGDISSMATHGYSSDKALDALKQAADIGSSFLSYSPLANAKYLNKAEDVYSLSKATASNLEDPTSLDDQYSFYSSLGKLSGIKKKGGSSKPCPKGKIYDPITKQCVSEESYQILDYIGTNKQNLNTKQAVIENQNYLDADKFLTDYYNSPRYKQMVYGSAITPEAAAWIIKSRNKQLETTPPLQVLQQPKDSPSTAGQSWSDTGQIEVFPAGFGTAATSVHELSHSSDRPIKGWNRLIPQKDINYINEHKAKMLGDSREYFDYLDYYKSLSKEELAEENKNFKEYYTDYVGDPTETRARLNEIRYLSKQNNLYDPFTQKVTPEIFKNKLKNFKYETDDKSGFDPMMQLKNTFSDEEIIYMLNNISQNENPETNDELQYSKKGGPIQLELSDEEIQDYIKRGYVIEEAVPKMSSGGKVVSELWTEITGTPWQEAKTRGLTTGTFDENIALRNRLLAGEFGKINNAVAPKTNYDLSVEELVKKGKTLDDLVSMKVGTRSGLMSRFPELFDEETKNKVEAQLDEEENKNYGLQAKINTNPYSDFGKTKNKIKSSKSNKISVNSIKPHEFSSFDLGSSWKNKMYSDFGKPKKENKSEKKDANNFQNNLGIKVDVSSIKAMKKDPIIKNMIDRMEANTKKLKTIESKPLSGSTMPLGPMALDWSKTDFSKGKNNMIVPLGTPMTPVEKLWASIPKSKEEVLETEWGKWGAKRALELGVLPKIAEQQLRRKLEKEGEIDTPDKIIKLNKKEETKTKLPEVKPKVDTYYQEIATVQDSYDSDNTLLSYRNQWDNNEGFVYYATPVKKDRSENDEYSNVKGVAHFLLDASASKSKPYTHEYNKSLIERAKRNNDYVPVFTPEKDEFVRLKYKRANDLKKDDKVITPLRQMKFDEIDFSQTQKPDGFKKGINEVKKKDGQGTYLLFKERDGYSRFSGGSVVFIFNDNFGNTIVRDFAGSLNQIENEGLQIKRRYGLTNDNLVIGYHDVGSFSAKIKANNNNKLKAKQWEGFNNEDWTGGALLIPK